MTSRGLVGGLVVVGAAAPFVAPSVALVLGLIMGVLTPLGIYLFKERLGLEDSGVFTAHATAGLLGLIAVGFFANGAHGAGWNGTGIEEHSGVAGQGVSGLLVAPGFASDWPGQVTAQLIGAASTAAWSFALSFAAFWLIAQAVQAWEKTGLEFGTVPEMEQAEEQPETEENVEEQESAEWVEPETETE
jgi:Amt family ammonium transporter